MAANPEERTGDTPTMSFQTILFPSDFDPESYKALPFVHQMAAPKTAKIYLLHVFPELPAVGGELGHFYASGVFDLESFVSAAKLRLEALGSWLPDRAGGLEVAVRFGDPASEIDTFAKEMNVDLIVMPTHRKGFFESLFKGSVTEAALRNAPCPVLAIPDGWEARMSQEDPA